MDRLPSVPSQPDMTTLFAHVLIDSIRVRGRLASGPTTDPVPSSAKCCACCRVASSVTRCRWLPHDAPIKGRRGFNRESDVLLKSHRRQLHLRLECALLLPDLFDHLHVLIHKPGTDIGRGRQHCAQDEFDLSAMPARVCRQTIEIGSECEWTSWVPAPSVSSHW